VAIRFEPGLKQQLQDAAAANAVSFTKEVEDRLAKSLARDRAEKDYGRPETDALLGALRRVVDRVEELTGAEWYKDGFTRDAVADAVHWLVRHLGPPADYGSAQPPSAFPAFITDWTGNTPAPFDFQAGEWEGERQEMQAKIAQVLIKQGVGKRCAEKTIFEMAAPLPEDQRLRHEIEFGYREERTDGAILAGLMSMPNSEKAPGQ